MATGTKAVDEKVLVRLDDAYERGYLIDYLIGWIDVSAPGYPMLRHYNIAAVLTDSPPSENLQFLSDVIVTANQSFIRFHGRNTTSHYWYNYLYSEQELKPWVEKVNQIREQTKILRIYFNNHYGAKAVVNAMQFKEMNGISLSADERKVLESTRTHILGNY